MPWDQRDHWDRRRPTRTPRMAHYSFLGKSRSVRAFSLLEVLAVLATAAFLLTLAAQSSLPSRDHLAPQTAAREFQSLLCEARLLAMEHRTPTRIVFIPASLSGTEPAQSGEDPYVECAIFRFVIPSASERTVEWRSPALENSVRGGDALERIPVCPPGLPAELVGRWQQVPRKPFRFGETLDRSLRVRSEVLDRFASQSPAEFAAENAFHPLAFWEAGGNSPWEGRCQSSPFPPNYHRTPWPQSPQLVHETLPAQARVYDPQAGRWQSASAYWPSDSPTPHFRVSEVDALTFHDLPWIEFDAQGRMQIHWDGEREVVFEIKDRPEFHARVNLGAGDTPARLAGSSW